MDLRFVAAVIKAVVHPDTKVLAVGKERPTILFKNGSSITFLDAPSETVRGERAKLFQTID